MVKIVGEVLVRHAKDDGLEPCPTREVLADKVVGYVSPCLLLCFGCCLRQLGFRLVLTQK